MTDQSESALRAMFGPPQDGVFSGTVVKERSARTKYWRKPDGWITTGPDVQTDAPKYQQYIGYKRYRELPDSFGREAIGTGDITVHHRVGEEHRWLKPFMEAGGLTYQVLATDPFRLPGEEPGAYLIPAAQLVELNLHRSPEVRAARPDLGSAVDLECPYGCVMRGGRRRLFSGITKDEAQASVDQHIVSVHKDAVASRAVGDTIAQAMQGFNGAQVNTEMIATIAAAVVQAMTGVERGAVAAVVPKEAPAAMPDNVFTDDTDINTLNRQQLMGFAKWKGMEMPEKPLSLDTTAWRQWVAERLPIEDE